MSDVEPIVIILLTYSDDGVRTPYALRTIASVRQRLIYPDLLWYIADGGSSDDHKAEVKAALEGARVLGAHSTEHAQTSYGRDANMAWDKAHHYSRLTFWLEDDWELQHDLDLRPYADMILNCGDVGMVRLGYIQLGLRGETWGYGGHLYWRLDRESPDPHVFTGHPSLRHIRFREAYGPYSEGLSPGVNELDYAWKFRNGAGPGIVWPAAFGHNGVFGHIGAIQSYTL